MIPISSCLQDVKVEHSDWSYIHTYKSYGVSLNWREICLKVTPENTKHAQIVQYALLILKQFFHEEKENIWRISKKKGILDG